jgi:hypothetical protein
MTTETVKEPRVNSMKSVSSLIIERLTNEPAFRKAFQTDPAAAMRDCGVPERLLPDQHLATSIDFIELGRKLTMYESDTASIAVACVVI